MNGAQAAESTFRTIKSLISDSPRSSDFKLRWDKVGDHRQGGHTNKKSTELTKNNVF